jgi:hypothetical protein
MPRPFSRFLCSFSNNSEYNELRELASPTSVVSLSKSVAEPCTQIAKRLFKVPNHAHKQITKARVKVKNNVRQLRQVNTQIQMQCRRSKVAKQGPGAGSPSLSRSENYRNLMLRKHSGFLYQLKAKLEAGIGNKRASLKKLIKSALPSSSQAKMVEAGEPFTMFICPITKRSWEFDDKNLPVFAASIQGESPFTQQILNKAKTEGRKVSFSPEMIMAQIDRVKSLAEEVSKSCTLNTLDPTVIPLPGAVFLARSPVKVGVLKAMLEGGDHALRQVIDYLVDGFVHGFGLGIRYMISKLGNKPFARGKRGSTDENSRGCGDRRGKGNSDPDRCGSSTNPTGRLHGGPLVFAREEGAGRSDRENSKDQQLQLPLHARRNRG